MIKIGNSIIPLPKVKQYWQECCAVLPENQKTQEMLKKIFVYAKNKMIETALLELMMEKENREIPFENIQEEYKKIIHEKKIVEISKSDKYLLQSQIEKDLKIRNLLKDWQENILSPTEEECLRHYEENKNQWKENEKFIFKALIVKKKQTNAKQEAENLFDFFHKNGDFENLKKYQNENIEYKNKLAIEKNVLPAEIEDALLTMRQGETSSIIESKDSYSFFQYIDYIPEGYYPYLKIKEKIKQNLFLQKKEKIKNQKIMDYKNKINIEDKLKFEDLVD